MSIYDLIPIPKLTDAKRVLCVQPHPDDMDLACGGTLAALADQGVEVAYLTVTDGSAGSFERTPEAQVAAVRRAEQTAAGAIIGVSHYDWLDYPDAAPVDEARLQDDLVRAIRTLRPDTLVTVDPWLLYESHPAHRAVGRAAAAAALLSGLPNISPGQIDEGLPAHSVARIVFAFTANGNTYVDITGTWERKMKAMQAHKSQFPESTWPGYEAYWRSQAATHGKAAGCDLAESLRVLTPTHLHCNVDL